MVYLTGLSAIELIVILQWRDHLVIIRKENLQFVTEIYNKESVLKMKYKC